MPIQILVVEDNAGDRFLIQQTLKGICPDWKLHFAENGVDATDFLHQTGAFTAAPRPQLVIVDLNLPRKDGREVLAEIKQDPALQTIPVIIFSSSRIASDVENCYRLGANAFLTKPSELDDFTTAIKSLAQFWLQKAVLASTLRAD